MVRQLGCIGGLGWSGAVHVWQQLLASDEPVAIRFDLLSDPHGQPATPAQDVIDHADSQAKPLGGLTSATNPVYVGFECWDVRLAPNLHGVAFRVNT